MMPVRAKARLARASTLAGAHVHAGTGHRRAVDVERFKLALRSDAYSSRSRTSNVCSRPCCSSIAERICRQGPARSWAEHRQCPPNWRDPFRRECKARRIILYRKAFRPRLSSSPRRPSFSTPSLTGMRGLVLELFNDDSDPDKWTDHG